MTTRLDEGSGLPNNDSAIMPPVIVEYPDQDGRRWQRALEILLEAGRTARQEESAA
jgi:hypothetical protein